MDTSSGPDPPVPPPLPQGLVGAALWGEAAVPHLPVLDETRRAEPQKVQPELGHVVLATPSQPHRTGRPTAQVSGPWVFPGRLADFSHAQTSAGLGPGSQAFRDLGPRKGREDGGFPPHSHERRSGLFLLPGEGLLSDAPSHPPGACLAGRGCTWVPGWTGGWVGR